MEENEAGRHQALLGVKPGCNFEELEDAYARKTSALGAAGSRHAGEELRVAYNKIAARLRAEGVRHLPPAESGASATPAAGPVSVQPGPTGGAAAAPVLAAPEVFPLLAFDHWPVNVLVPPLLLGLVWLINRSPLAFFLQGFQVWMHEFGHATAAWMCGHRAVPLPFGWTPVEPEHSDFVYFGLLLLFAILFVAGWRERKVWPMLAAVVFAGVQYHMTWQLTERQQEFWWSAFGGVGGSFYLSAAMMASFFVELPEKFRWGACRYVFFLIGATAFLESTDFWSDVCHGLKEIPFGSMIGGEDDQNGDMNKLMDLFHWKNTELRNHFHALGHWCWAGLGVVYATFALRLNVIPDKIVDWNHRRRGALPVSE